MEYSNEANQSELQGFYMNKIREKKTLPRGKIFGRWCRGKNNKTTENNRAVTGFFVGNIHTHVKQFVANNIILSLLLLLIMIIIAKILY